MFELSVACKYLLPRRRQLSVSIISLISILVISLVVWLIIVFFSVTDGLEKSWIKKLTALTAPVRLTPTEAYYNSYYYQIDGISSASDYSTKTIGEKQEALLVDPYDPESDQEIPPYWPLPDRSSEGSLKDLVKLAYTSLEQISDVRGLRGQEFELTATHIRLNLLRFLRPPSFSKTPSPSRSSLSYPAYLGNFDGENPHIKETLLPIDGTDWTNLLYLMGVAPAETEEEESSPPLFDAATFQRRLAHFFSHVSVQQLKAPLSGWLIPRRLLPEGQWKGIALLRRGKIVRLVVPQKEEELLSLQNHLEEQGLTGVPGLALLKENALFFQPFAANEPQPLPPSFSLTLAGGAPFSARLNEGSLKEAKHLGQLLFSIALPLQGTLLKGEVPVRGLEIARAIPQAEYSSSWWLSPSSRPGEPEGSVPFILPQDPDIGEGLLLPKSFRDVGVLVGDRGFLSYLAPTASLLQEQLIPVYVAGFYDPGIIPIGGKFLLANKEVTSLIRASHQQEDKAHVTNGINVHFDRLDQTDAVKARLLASLKEKGIHRYWNIETYREYEFTKEIIQELQSQKNLFMLIAVVIIIVACSNIISMLIILVNDKKIEIGILRSMGASSQSIALIFGISGAIIGVLGSLVGTLVAILTLRYLDPLIGLLSRLQGHEMFSAHVYGPILPHELSLEALSFVLGATVCLSLIAGIVPAIKACLLRPSHILRANGGG